MKSIFGGVCCERNPTFDAYPNKNDQEHAVNPVKPSSQHRNRDLVENVG
jgi:hypothetical protein